MAISHTLQFTTVHYNTCRNSEDCFFTVDSRLGYWLVTNSATHLYSRGTWLRLLLRHSRNTSRDVYRAAAARAFAILFAASHSTVAWLPSNCCKQTPYCLQHVRHNIYKDHVSVQSYVRVRSYPFILPISGNLILSPHLHKNFSF
jgi:hypothetical protein